MQKSSTYVFLRKNSPEIRQAIKDAGLTLCACAEFKNAIWLDGYSDQMEYDVHGNGYDDDGDDALYKGMTPEQICEFSVAENKECGNIIIDCKENVDEFMNQLRKCKRNNQS